MFSVKLYQEIERLEPDMKSVMYELLAEIEHNREESVNRDDFLSVAKQTDENFQHVWQSITELTESQKRTEQKVQELTEAQKRTEQKVQELTESQKKTELIVQELAEAQKRTEHSIEKLITETERLSNDMISTKEMVAGLSDTVGYGLEDRAIKGLPDLLLKKYDITVTSALERKFIQYNGKKDELNIYGLGLKDNQEIYILGEAKSRLSVKNIDKFIKMLARLKKYGVIKEPYFGFMISYSIDPVVAQHALNKGISLIMSYEV